MQVSEKERELMLQNIRKELINIVSSRIVHPDTNRLFPPNIIEEAIQKLGFDVKINDSAKKQANFLIKELSSRYYIKKADMEIKVTIREEWVSTGEDTEAVQSTTNTKQAKIDLDGDDEIQDKPKKKITSSNTAGEETNSKSGANTDVKSRVDFTKHWIVTRK